MSLIQVVQAMSTGLTTAWDNVQSVQVGSPLVNGEGGFGEVFECLDINGSAIPMPLVIKILKRDPEGNYKRGYRTIRRLQERIRAKNLELKRIGKSVAEVPGLYALPQFSFEGRLGNQNVLGYAAHKLDSSRFCSFSDALQLRFPEYRRLDLNRKYQLALDLAECFSLLREVNYIHADINPQNLFINLQDGHMVLIDYDSGVVVDHPQDAPTTWGKPNEWIAPEVEEQKNNKSASGQTMVTVDLFTDTWSVAVGMHYILFDQYPYFFLNVLGPRELKDYLSKFRWPAVDLQYPNFYGEELNRYKNLYLINFDGADPVLKRAFEVTFNEGVIDRGRRTSYAQWVQFFKSRVKPIPFATASVRLPPPAPVKIGVTASPSKFVSKTPVGIQSRYLLRFVRNGALVLLGSVLVLYLLLPVSPDKGAKNINTQFKNKTQFDVMSEVPKFTEERNRESDPSYGVPPPKQW